MVDMNRNGIRDRRETIAQAWQRRAAEGERTGVLMPNEELTPEKYQSCVEQAASALVAQGLLSGEAFAHYVEQAAQPPLGLTSR